MEWSILFRRKARVLLFVATTLAVALAGCATPEVVPTSTQTPTPTPPWPISTPEAGKGNTWGQVMWNDKPVAGAEVEMGTGITVYIFGGGTELHEPVYKTTTDAEGYYLFANVEPGGYVRRVKGPDPSFGSWEYPDGEFTYKKSYVEAEQTIGLKACHLEKNDLELNTPANGAPVAYDKLVLTWEIYPDANNFEVWLRPEYGPQQSGQTNQTSYIHPQSLLNGEYTWGVSAYNQNGRVIASAGGRTFTVTGAAYSMYVEIVSPYGPFTKDAKVSGTALTFQWKPYPGAAYYEIDIESLDEAGVDIDTKVTGTSYTVTQVLKPGRCWWWVRAYDNSGDELAKSDTHYFIVQ